MFTSSSSLPETVVAVAADWPVCWCGADRNNLPGGFFSCDENGLMVDKSVGGGRVRCAGCGLMFDATTFDEKTHTMRVVGEVRPPCSDEQPATPRMKAPSTRSCAEFLIPGDVTLEYTREWTKRLVDKVAPLMPGEDPARADAKAFVDLVLRELLDEVCDNYDLDTGRLVSSRVIHASELRQLIREVRTAPNVLAEAFIDHEQIERWAAFVLTTATGREPDRAVFTGDCHGIYVGPAKELVRRGERVEAVVAPGQVWFRRERPETGASLPLCDGEFQGVRVARIDTNEQGTARLLSFTHDVTWAATAARWLVTQQRGGEPPASVEVGERRWVQITPDCRCAPNVYEQGHNDEVCLWWPAPEDQAPWDGWYARTVRPYTEGAYAVTTVEVWDAR